VGAAVIFSLLTLTILLAASTAGYVACGAFIATGHPWIAALAFVTQMVMGNVLSGAIRGVGEPR
jgi:uncharacterized protein (UPF0333 family)